MLNGRKQQTEEVNTFVARAKADEQCHLESCQVCRNRLRPADDQSLYGVKNARTRQFVHILVNGKSVEETIGWPREDILYSVLLGGKDYKKKGPPMTEEIKARLRAAAAERKLKKSLRANTPARLEDGDNKKEETVDKKIFGYRSLAPIMAWMAKDGFTRDQILAALKKTGCTKMPSNPYVRDCLNNKYEPAKLTAEQQKILRDTVKGNNEKLAKKSSAKPVKKSKPKKAAKKAQPVTAPSVGVSDLPQS